MSRRLLLCLWLVGCISWPTSAIAGTCGHQQESELAIGSLDPDVPGSRYELTFQEGDPRKRNLLLIFDVNGCKLGPRFANDINVDYEFADIEDWAFAKTADATYTRVSWVISVDPTKLDPGINKGYLVLGSRENVVKRVTIPIVLSESEDEIVAFRITGLAWLLGLVGAYVLTSESVRSWKRVVVGIFFTLAPVYGILKAQYFDVPGWTGSDVKAFLFISATAASFGAAKAAMLDLSKDEKDEKDKKAQGWKHRIRRNRRGRQDAGSPTQQAPVPAHASSASSQPASRPRPPSAPGPPRNP